MAYDCFFITDELSVNDVVRYKRVKEKIPNVLINNAGITKDQLFLRMKDVKFPVPGPTSRIVLSLI